MAQKIATLTEDIEELKSEKVLLLNQLNCVGDHGVGEMKQHITSMGSSLETLNQQKEKYTAELDVALMQYAELRQQTADMDVMKLDAARCTIRSDKECETTQHLLTAYGKRFDSRILAQSRKDIVDLLSETAASVSIRQKLKRSCKQEVNRLITKGPYQKDR